MKYQVVDSQTKYVIGIYSTLKRAVNKADKLDLIYGAIRYRVEQVKEIQNESGKI